VEEVSLTSEVHGHTGSLSRGNYLSIANRTTRLHYRSHTSIQENLKAVGKREKRV
jgi:hypothetical protein